MLKLYIKYFDTAVFTLNFHFINFCLDKLVRNDMDVNEHEKLSNITLIRPKFK
jgi:hypothetical protein